MDGAAFITFPRTQRQRSRRHGTERRWYFSSQPERAGPEPWRLCICWQRSTHSFPRALLCAVCAPSFLLLIPRCECRRRGQASVHSALSLLSGPGLLTRFQGVMWSGLLGCSCGGPRAGGCGSTMGKGFLRQLPSPVSLGAPQWGGDRWRSRWVCGGCRAGGLSRGLCWVDGFSQLAKAVHSDWCPGDARSLPGSSLSAPQLEQAPPWTPLTLS